MEAVWVIHYHISPFSVRLAALMTARRYLWNVISMKNRLAVLFGFVPHFAVFGSFWRAVSYGAAPLLKYFHLWTTESHPRLQPGGINVRKQTFFSPKHIHTHSEMHTTIDFLKQTHLPPNTIFPNKSILWLMYCCLVLLLGILFSPQMNE